MLEQADMCDTYQPNAPRLAEGEPQPPLPLCRVPLLQMTDKEKTLTNQIKNLEGDLAALAR